jgi:hypothetical protein
MHYGEMENSGKGPWPIKNCASSPGRNESELTWNINVKEKKLIGYRPNTEPRPCLTSAAFHLTLSRHTDHKPSTEVTTRPVVSAQHHL